VGVCVCVCRGGGGSGDSHVSVRGGRCGRGDGVEKLQGGARGGKGGGGTPQGRGD
jgi:hypothetical protein